MARSAPEISHLLFADDSYFFFRACVDEAVILKNCFKVYSKASGQVINFDKSSL